MQVRCNTESRMRCSCRLYSDIPKQEAGNSIPFKRTLETIGEGCRFLRLIALKGWKWFKEKSKDIVEFSEILNSYVFVKNAKV